MGKKKWNTIFSVLLTIVLFSFSGCSLFAPSAESAQSDHSGKPHADTGTSSDQPSPYTLAASQGSARDAVTSVLYNDTEAYFTYNQTLYHYTENEATPVPGPETAYNIAGMREDGLYLIVKDSTAPEPAYARYSGKLQASLDVYNPDTQKSERIITDIQGAVLAGENNEILLYYLFDPAETEWGYRLKAYMRNLDTGEEQEIFVDEYVVTDVYVDEQVDEPAFDCYFRYEDDKIALILSYPYPSEYPYIRTIMLGANGTVLEDSEGLLAPAPPGADSSYSSWWQDFSLDCGNYVVYAEQGDEEHKINYVTEIDGNPIIIDSNIYSNQTATNGKGLFYYNKSNPYSNNVSLMVFNGVVSVSIPYPQQGRLPYSEILQYENNVYYLFYDDQYGMSADESPAENRIAIYQATGTLDNPTKLQQIFPQPGDEALFMSAGEWYRGIKYYQAGKLLLVDGQYPSSLLLFNLENHEYTVIT